MDQQRFAQQPRGHTRRPRHVSSHSHHTARGAAVYQPQGLHRRQHQVNQAQQLVQNRLAAHTAHRQAVQRYTRGRHYPVLQPPVGTNPLHPVTAFHKLAGNCQGRVHVPPGATGSHQHQRCIRGTHGRLPDWRESRSMRNTIASMQQQIIRLVPP